MRRNRRATIFSKIFGQPGPAPMTEVLQVDLAVKF